MERIIRNRSATLRKTFYENGVATDPTGTPTVTVTRADGTLVTTGSVTNELEAGTWSVTIPATNNTLLDTLTVAWSGTVSGVAQQYVDIVEVAGDALFTISQARTALGDQAYDAQKIADARTYAESELEGALGFALVPRFTVDTVTGQPGRQLRLRHPYVRAIRSATVNGTALTAGDLAALSFDRNGFVTGYGGFYAPGWGTTMTTLGNVVVGYEHGLDTPSPGATRAALALALDALGDTGSGTGIDPRAESIVTVDGTVRLRAFGGQFSAAGVNEWIAANRLVMVA